MAAARVVRDEGWGQVRARGLALEAPVAMGMPHRREGIMAPTNPAVRVRITVIRTPQIGFAGANRIGMAEPVSMLWLVCSCRAQGTSDVVADQGETVAGVTTKPGTEPIERLRRRRTARRFGIGAIGLIVLLGLGNLVGVRTGIASAAADGVTLAVTYAQVTRSGLETPWKVEVRSLGGFDGPVTITTTAEYFERFDFNQWYPEPSGTTLRDDLLVLTFDRPQGEVLLVRLDGRASPTFGLGSRATTSLDTDGMPALSVGYRTVAMP